MDGSWPGPERKNLSSPDFAITCIRSATLSASPPDIVPHQIRHTYATEMLRAGVSFPVLMKLLGHTDPRHDHALCRCDLDRSPARVPTGSLQTQASGSPAQNLTRAPAHRPRRRHRFLTRRSTCHGDVPPIAPKRPCTQSASTGSPTDSPRSSPRYENSKSPE